MQKEHTSELKVPHETEKDGSKGGISKINKKERKRWACIRYVHAGHDGLGWLEARLVHVASTRCSHEGEKRGWCIHLCVFVAESGEVWQGRAAGGTKLGLFQCREWHTHN